MIIPGTFVWHKGHEMFNTAYILYNGEVIFQYNKMTEGGEKSIASRHNLIPNYGDKLGVFQWGNLKLGIEICADGGILKRHKVKNRDLAFLISAGNYFLDYTMNAVRAGGYGVVADGVMKIYSSKQQQKANPS